MEIKNSLLKNLDPYRATIDPKADGANARAKGTETAAAPAQGDRVSISSTAMLHTTAHATIANAPEVRQGRVDALKELVSSGAYQVDAKKVAMKLLESESLLAGTLNGGAE